GHAARRVLHVGQRRVVRAPWIEMPVIVVVEDEDAKRLRQGIGTMAHPSTSPATPRRTGRILIHCRGTCLCFQAAMISTSPETKTCPRLAPKRFDRHPRAAESPGERSAQFVRE